MNEKTLVRVMLDLVNGGGNREKIREVPLFKELSEDFFEDLYEKAIKIKEEMKEGITFKEAWDFYDRK